jgi:hypothetical protein
MAKAKTEVKQEKNKIHEQEIQTGELAAIVGKSDRWIRQLTKDKVLTQVDRGKYILGETVQAYIEHVSGGKEEDNKPRLIDYKTEHERVKQEKAEIQLRQMRGELHSSEDVESVMSDMLTAFRQKILAIPTKLSPQLTGIDDIKTIKGKLTAALHEALTELANYNPDMFREDATGVDPHGES